MNKVAIDRNLWAKARRKTLQAIICKGTAVQKRKYSAPVRIDHGTKTGMSLMRSDLLGCVAPVFPFFFLTDGLFPGFLMSISEAIKILKLWAVIFDIALLKGGSNKIVHGVIMTISL